MINKILTNLWILFVTLLLGSQIDSFAQQTVITGIVTDAKTNEPLPYVVIVFDLIGQGTITEVDGTYKLTTNQPYTSISAHLTGYLKMTKQIVPGEEQIINFKIKPEPNQLKEVVIKGKKAKYSNKNNPAVDLIRKVIEHKSENRKSGFDYYEYEKYEKIQMGLSNIDEKFRNKKSYRKFQVIFDNLDSTKLEGKAVLPFYMKETISDVWYRKSPKAQKEIVKGEKKITYDGYLNDQGLDAYMKYLYQDIDIYADNIMMLTNQFLSPIATVSPTFYKFSINDTVMVDSVKCILLGFVPRNRTDFLYEGFLYITMDSAYAVKKLDMTVSKDINLNWVKELRVVQDFKKKNDIGYALATDEFTADFGITNGKRGIFGQRIVSYEDYKLNQPRSDAQYAGEKLEVLPEATTEPDSFWVKNRHVELSKSEKKYLFDH